MSKAVELYIRTMQPHDFEAAMRLKGLAGWNQILADWEALVELQPESCFVGEVDGTVAATATALPYGDRFGWIGMILVEPNLRRQGIATRMMGKAISHLEVQGSPCQKLDATRGGVKVYERMGFKVEYQVERWKRPVGTSPETDCDRSAIRELGTEGIDLLEQWDARLFGAPRGWLLRWYCRKRYPCFVKGDPEAPLGFLLGRPGSGAFHLGPLVADDPETARELLAHVLELVGDGPVIADIVTPNPEAVPLLESFGFQRSRVLQRMYRGENQYRGHPEKIYCAAGFEFG